MPGAVDANGVYIFAEDDPLSPFSSFLNLGQNAASALAARAPRGVLPNGYVALVANTTVNATTLITATPVDVPALSCAVTVGANRRIKITFDGMGFTTVVNDRAQVGIREGSTMLNYSTAYPMNSAGTGMALHCEVILVPTAGLHTYKISIGRGSGTGNINLVGSAGASSSILVEDIGSSN